MASAVRRHAAPEESKARMSATKTGLLTAAKRAKHSCGPAGLNRITGNNAPKLRNVVKLIHELCDGRHGTRFYLGSVALGTLFGVHNAVALRWLKQLERQGVIRRTWTGGMCRNDRFGRPLAHGQLVGRASEYVYAGIPGA